MYSEAIVVSNGSSGSGVISKPNCLIYKLPYTASKI